VNRYQFLLSEGARGDLNACRRRDPKSAAAVYVILQEIHSSERACEDLVDERFFDEVVESVQGLVSLQDRRINAYRVRLCDAGNWRLIMAVDHRSRRVGLLGVMPRSVDYEADRALWDRIEREYDGLGFARY